MNDIMNELNAALNSMSLEMMLIWGLGLLLPILPNLWSIWHAFFRQFPTETEKLAWLGAAIFVPVLGGLAYLFVGCRRAKKYEDAG